MRAFIGLVVAVLVAVAIGVAALPTSSSAVAAVATASARTSDAGSAALNLSLTTSGLPGGVNIRATGTGQTDLKSGASEMQVTYSGSPQLNGLALEEISVAGHFYMRIPQLTKAHPGIDWIGVPTGDVAASTNGAGLNPAATLRLMQQRGATVRPIADATIDGTSDKGYSIDLNASVLKRELLKEHLSPALRQAALQSLSITNAIDIEVWITPSNELRRMSMTYGLKLATAPSAKITAVVDLEDLGAPVKVTAPPSSEVTPYSTYLKIAESVTT